MSGIGDNLKGLEAKIEVLAGNIKEAISGGVKTEVMNNAPKIAPDSISCAKELNNAREADASGDPRPASTPGCASYVSNVLDR